jgi:hypothetical protein
MTESRPSKLQLMERIEGGWAELDRLQAALDDAANPEPAGGGWSLKDHLAHIAVWELSLVALLTGDDREAAVGVPAHATDTDSINAIIHERLRGLTAAEVRALLRGTRAQLRDALAPLTDADLVRPYSHYQPHEEGENRPVIGWILGNTADHVAEHVDAMRALAGTPASH